MVVKRMLYSDFDFSSFPKAPRSIRRKVPSSQRRDDVDCGMMRAIDLLASVAEKLQEEEGETSSNSINAFEEGYYNQNRLAGKIKQEHQANLASSKSPSENASDVSLEQTQVSDCKRGRGLNPLAGCGNKKEDCDFHVESGGVTVETCVVNNVEDGGLISLKDPSQLHVQCPEPVHLDGVPNEYRNRSKLVCRDDDENCCKYYKCKDKCNKSYSPSLTWAGHRRAVHRSKCFEGTKTDDSVKALDRKRKLCCRYSPRKHETLHKKRRLSDKGLVVNSDGGITSESVTNSTEKRESENGVLSDAIGLHSEDSRVKFSIKSLRIPELFIEVPETATVGSLKRTVMEAVSALLDDGISIGVTVQGRKVRDDNNTLSQTGLSCRENLGNLGFTLEPGPEKLGVPLSSENPVMSKPTDSTKLSERSAANCVENNSQELVPYQMDISADEQQPSSDSRAMVSVSALEPEALAIVPFKEKPKRTELSQRRIRRPFSVTEVEALVNAVEELGPDDTVIDIGEDWANGVPLDFNDPRIFAMAAAERRFFDPDYDEYADSNSSGAAFLRSAALILMALLLLRHAMNLSNNNSDDEEDDPSAFFFLFMLRAAAFLLPCYIMAWAISILQRRRQRQEAAALAAAEVAFMLHSGAGGVQRRGGLHFAVAPELISNPQHQSEAAPQ